jgi:hypothetical protein
VNKLKNVQVIDGAENCTFSIFQMTDKEFKAVFSRKGQDIAFIEDVVKRLGNSKAGKVLAPVWNRPALKKNIVGLHGTLFYEFQHKKKYFPRSRRHVDWSEVTINEAERRLHRENKK